MTLTQIKPAGLSKPVDLADNEKIRLGTGNDFEIHHNGNNSLISNSTGDLIIDSGGTSSTVLRSRFDSTVFNNAANNLNQLVLDGGMVRLYESGNEKFRTLSTGAKITGDVESTTGIFERTNNGTSQLKFNNTNETQLKHLSNGQVKFSLIGYNSAFGGAIDAQTSSNYIRILNAADEQAVTCRTNGAVELYYDNSKKFETRSNGVAAFGDVLCDSDSGKFKAGLSGDLTMYHNGSHSFIDNLTGTLYFRTPTNLSFATNSTEDAILCMANGAVQLYHDNAIKLATTASGIELAGVENAGAQLKIGASGDFTIEHDSSNTYLKNTTGDTVIQNDAAVEITASSGGTKRFRFDSDGIKFGSDTAAANALDDYEEGTYTADLYRTSSNVTFSRRKGRYIRIGNMCFVWFDIQTISNNSSGSGAWRVSLPFVFANNSSGTAGLDNAGHGAPSFRDMSFMSRDQGYKTSSYINGDYIELRYINNSNAETNMIENGSAGRVTGQAWGYLSQAS